MSDGDSDAGRPEDWGTWRENVRWQFRQHGCDHSICEDHNRTRVRKTMKATTPADAITAIGRSGPRMSCVSRERRRGRKQRPIAKVAVRRMNCQARQDGTQQPSNDVASSGNGPPHVSNDKSLRTRKPGASCDQCDLEPWFHSNMADASHVPRVNALRYLPAR